LSREARTHMDRVEAFVKRAEEKRGYVPVWLQFMGQVDFEFLEAYEAYYEVSGARSVHLPQKFKELITVAALAVERDDYGLNDHIRRALRLGATKEEITETLQAAAFHTGALTLVHGMMALLKILKEDPSGGARATQTP